jgi:hypothetical protein
MLTAVEGVYKNGKVELSEVPADIEDGRVIVTFLDSARRAPGKGTLIQFGMFPQLRDLTEEGFKLAEWRGEEVEI